MKKTCLFHHVVAEDMVAVEDFDGNMGTSLDVLGELDLRKATFANGFPQLVFPHSGSSSRCLRSAAHSATTVDVVE